MLTSLTMTRFKSWLSLKATPLAPITGLFGPNSSGKTSILQLLLLLKQTVESPDRRQALNLGDERSLVSLGTFRDVIFEHNTDAGLAFGLSWNLPRELKLADPQKKGTTLFSGKDLLFSAGAAQVGRRRPFVPVVQYGFAGHDFLMKGKPPEYNKYEISVQVAQDDAVTSKSTGFRFIRTPGRPWELPSPVKCYGFPPQVRTYYQNAAFLHDFELAFEELCSRMYYLGPLREHPKREYTWAGAQPADMGERGQNVVDALLASRERGEKISRGSGNPKFTVEEYVAWWLKKLKLIHDFTVAPISADSNLYRVWVRQDRNAAEVLLTDVGFGVSQILPVITLCYYVPKGSIILLEQPEIHLHPSVQAGLADVFIDAVKNRKVQIIVESHSEHLLRRLQRRIAEEELKADDAALYFCNMVKGKSQLTALQLDLFGNITNWPKDFFGDEFGEMAAMTEAQMKRKMKASG